MLLHMHYPAPLHGQAMRLLKSLLVLDCYVNVINLREDKTLLRPHITIDFNSFRYLRYRFDACFALV